MDKSERGAGDSRGPQSGQLKLMNREGGREMRGREEERSFPGSQQQAPWLLVQQAFIQEMK